MNIRASGNAQIGLEGDLDGQANKGDGQTQRGPFVFK